MFRCPANLSRKVCVLFTCFTLFLLCYVISRESLTNLEPCRSTLASAGISHPFNISSNSNNLLDYSQHSSDSADTGVDSLVCVSVSSLKQRQLAVDGTYYSYSGQQFTTDYTREIWDAGILVESYGYSAYTDINGLVSEI